MKLNENNIQAPFQYKISDKTFELKTVSGGFLLNADNVQIKVFSGERLFCADIGYAVDGAVEEMEFLIDSIKVYPQVLESLEDLQTVEVKDNEVYLIRNELDFKSIVFFPPIDLNKKFDFTVTTYSSTFSAFMFDEIAKKLNTLDINYPIKNYYESTDYKANDIIKYKGYLYRVFKDFTGDSTDYYIKNNCSLITPFKKLELDNSYKANELIEYNNNFFIVQEDFLYNQSSGVLTNLNGLLKPLQDMIIWFDGITKIYKNQIVIKDNILYKVFEDIENPIWDSIQEKIETLIKADNTFYDDANSGFGNNTNTVQKAIEKLKSGKQDSLIAGNNIDLNGNKISVNGGVNKEYITGTLYFINDLIINNEKIYKVNEDFTSSNWNTDISKCSLISTGEGSGSSEAIDVSFDNTNAQLQQLAGYDFPKFKEIISDNTIIYGNDGRDYTIEGSIHKENNDYYITINDVQTLPINNGIGVISIFSTKDTNKDYYLLAQFFELSYFKTSSFETDFLYEAEEGEIIVKNQDGEIIPNKQFKFAVFSGGMIIKTIDDSSLIINGKYPTYVSLNIKNRLLRNIDRYLFGYSFAFMSSQTITDFYHFELLENNGEVKFVGSYTLKEGAGNSICFYSPIIENYFNVSSGTVNIQNTNGITSSNGKPIKFGIYKSSNDEVSSGIPPYILFISYQDDSTIQVGDTITFNLTPDKNSTLEPVYRGVDNVQQAIEAIVRRLAILEN
ncbi:phage tail protein [Brachyspira sp. G79]|uniref:phage tail protein n=1 Tax=Brachyspira sp. G79 TaxID=1358104 RepID=UPI000BBBBB34|nr:phage tail protein [Brachyspira sp. G79]PCG20593.1 Hvp 101 VSH-1 tail protein [Brachyspira sp. G79]